MIFVADFSNPNLASFMRSHAAGVCEAMLQVCGKTFSKIEIFPRHL